MSDVYDDDPGRPPKYSNRDIVRKLAGGGQRNEHLSLEGRDTSWRAIGLQLGLLVLLVAVIAVVYLLF